jgi:hypothetical protein
MSALPSKPTRPWLPFVGTIVMATMAVMSGIDACVAVILGSHSIVRISLLTGCSFAFAALGGLGFALRRTRKAMR